MHGTSAAIFGFSPIGAKIFFRPGFWTGAKPLGAKNGLMQFSIFLGYKNNFRQKLYYFELRKFDMGLFWNKPCNYVRIYNN